MKKNFFLKIALGITSVLIVVFLAISFLAPDNKHAQLLSEANSLILQGRADAALERISVVDTPEADSLREDLKNFNSRQFKLYTLKKMTDSQREELKNKTLKEAYLKNTELNKLFINDLSRTPTVEELNKLFKKEDLQESFEKQYSSRGSFLPLENAIMANMNDPSSYKHIETKYIIDYDTGIATFTTKIRGKNAFGALVLTSYAAEYDINNKQFLFIREY